MTGRPMRDELDSLDSLDRRLRLLPLGLTQQDLPRGALVRQFHVRAEPERRVRTVRALRGGVGAPGGVCVWCVQWVQWLIVH